MVLESRHIVGLFLMIVVISGVVFTLGYILGRNQYETQVRAAALSPKEAPRESTETSAALKPEPAPVNSKTQQKEASPAPAASDWDFYKSAEAKKPEVKLDKPAKSSSPGPASPPAKNKAAPPSPAASRPLSAKTKSLLNAPLVPRGAYILQVAALTQENDALAIAESLQKKKFPAFVLTPSADHYYRVQVGPYADQKSAIIAKKGLDHEGFKAIVKH